MSLRKIKIHFLNNNTDPVINKLLKYLDKIFKDYKTELYNNIYVLRSLDNEFIICYDNFDVNLNIKIILHIESICTVSSSEASDILEYYIANKISNKIVSDKNVYICTTELINIFTKKEQDNDIV